MYYCISVCMVASLIYFCYITGYTRYLCAFLYYISALISCRKSSGSKDTIIEVILQKNDQGDEQVINFMSKNLRDSELNYTITEKQAYALVKFLKHFRAYVGYNKIKSFVPYTVVKDVLSQQDFLGSIGKWVSQIKEYDLEIKSTKIIKGQGLAKIMIEINQEAIEVGENEKINFIASEIKNNEW
jgi:hypothetical protein